MATTRDLPLASYPSGSRTFVKQIPNGLAGFRIAIARCTTADLTIWPDPASQIKMTVECSYDAGATFPANAGGASFGGAGGILSKAGIELALWTASCRFSPVEPNAVRITVEIINGPIRTFGDVTVN